MGKQSESRRGDRGQATTKHCIKAKTINHLIRLTQIMIIQQRSLVFAEHVAQEAGYRM